MNERVLFGKLLLLALLVIELTVVLLCIAMLSAEYEIAFADEAKKTYLAFAVPAQILVNLKDEMG